MVRTPTLSVVLIVVLVVSQLVCLVVGAKPWQEAENKDSNATPRKGKRATIPTNKTLAKVGLMGRNIFHTHECTDFM